MSEMASNTATHFQQQQQQQQTISPYQCKDCGLFLDSAESLNVHLQYTHKEDLLNKWSSQNGSTKNEENNNGKPTMIKREFPINNSSSSENSDSLAKSDTEFNKSSPEHVYGHPPTPQSNHSLSPYQSHENSAFSPLFQNYQQQIKVEQLSPNHQYHSYPAMGEQPVYPHMQFDSMNQNQGFDQDYPVHQSTLHNYRYFPYQRPQPSSMPSPHVSSGQIYPPQPTPSPSPQTCDKCGLICNSASQLVDHINMSHPPTPAPHLNSYQGNQHYMFGNEGQHLSTQIKTEEQSEILDLDSHQVFSKDDKNNSNQTPQIAHNVTTLVANWQPQPQSNMQAQMQDRLSMNNGQMKRFSQPNMIDQKIFQSAPPNQDFMSNGSAAPPRLSPTSNFGNFDHLPTQSTNAVINTPQVPTVQPAAPSAPTKSATWKSNEARRPKTYNCIACNKWFTSSGHLKRHYNTTLHKNAVKSSGQPDPASMPISAHHHPARDNGNSRDGSNSGSPNGDPKMEDGSNHATPPQYERPAPMAGHLQQPPNGPYDRQPPPNVPPLNTNLLHSPTLVSPMISMNNLTSNGNSPNGEAGPSTMNLESRGLLPLSSNIHNMHGFSMAPQLMSMEASQFQMYPNEEAPHATQDMAISSLNTSGEEFISTSFNRIPQLLPSFDEIQSLRFANRSYDEAGVGGGVSATNPYVFLTENYDSTVAIPEDFNKENELEDRLPGSDGGIYVYPADTLYVLPDSQYLDMANNNNNNNNDLDEKWSNYLKAQGQEAFTIRDESMPDSTVQNPPPKEKPTGEFVCVECDKKFNKACYLTQHNKNSHSGEKPFKCTRCGKRFNDQTSYDVHVTKHGEFKPHKCPKCKKCFNHKTDLRRHMFCHAGVKPHYCETCNKGFIRKDHMLKHEETHKRRAQMKGTTTARNNKKR